jgi:hypothetical protein
MLACVQTIDTHIVHLSGLDYNKTCCIAEPADAAARGVRRQASLSSPSAGPLHNPAHFEMIRNGSAPPVDWQRRRTVSSYPDNLIVETEHLTVAIKSLLADAQDGRLTTFASGHAVTVSAILLAFFVEPLQFY